MRLNITDRLTLGGKLLITVRDYVRDLVNKSLRVVTVVVSLFQSQECIPIAYVPPASVATTRCQYKPHFQGVSTHPYIPPLIIPTLPSHNHPLHIPILLYISTPPFTYLPISHRKNMGLEIPTHPPPVNKMTDRGLWNSGFWLAQYEDEYLVRVQVSGHLWTLIQWIKVQRCSKLILETHPLT